MSKIELLEQSKEKFSTLTSHGPALVGALECLEMRIKKCFGPESEYVSKLKEISFSPTIFVSGVRVDKEHYFQLGVESVKHLIDVMIEDLQLDEDSLSSSQKTSSNLQQDSQDTVLEKDNMVQNKKVFIAHGRDEGAKDTVVRVIERLKLEYVVLHEKPNDGLTIIDKFEQQIQDCGFGIVIYTPCDLGKNKDEEQEKPRARQNVVFEHGYLIGKLGRKKVFVLVKGDVETPSQLSGVIHETMDNHDAWRLGLAKALKHGGFDVDMNNLMEG